MNLNGHGCPSDARRTEPFLRRQRRRARTARPALSIWRLPDRPSGPYRHRCRRRPGPRAVAAELDTGRILLRRPGRQCCRDRGHRVGWCSRVTHGRVRGMVAGAGVADHCLGRADAARQATAPLMGADRIGGGYDTGAQRRGILRHRAHLGQPVNLGCRRRHRAPEVRLRRRVAFCHDVDFFASPEAAQPWLEEHPAWRCSWSRGLPTRQPLAKSLLGGIGLNPSCEDPRASEPWHRKRSRPKPTGWRNSCAFAT